MTAILRTTAILFLFGFASFARSSGPVEEPLVARANAWQSGQPIPGELLRYRDSGAVSTGLVIADPILDSRDSFLVFYGITNYALLHAVLFTTHDPRIFDLADHQAMVIGGPRRFYADLAAEMQRRPALASQPRFLKLCARAHSRQMILGMLTARDRNLPPKAADAAFRQMARDLRGGLTFEQAALRCQKAHVSADDPSSSRIADLGENLLAAPDSTQMFTPGITVPAVAARLMKAHSGDAFIHHDKLNEMTTFYAIREVYVPDP